MLEAEKANSAPERPSFMVLLGALPPYDLADLKTAYDEKTLKAQSDRDGNQNDLIRLKTAYEQAVDYVKCRGNRRIWIAEQVDSYVRQEEVIAEVLRRGGRVEVERSPWMEKSWGDGFPLLAERLRHVYVRDMSDGDKFLAFLADHRLPHLLGLDVSGSRVSSDGLRYLDGSEIIQWLDVSGTDVDCPGLISLLSCLPSLEWVNVKKTRLGWWGRWRLQRAHPRVRIVTEVPPDIKPGSETMEFRE